MTLQLMASPSQLIRHNAELPESNRQSMVLLRFAEPVSRLFAPEFYRIQLTERMKECGEGTFYQAELHQPRHTPAYNQCARCGQKMSQVGLTTMRCTTMFPRKCELYGRPQDRTPRRGVVGILIPSDRIVTDAGRGELTDTIVLVLDRRYQDEVLASVYRTAGLVCDQYGWKLS